MAPVSTCLLREFPLSSNFYCAQWTFTALYLSLTYLLTRIYENIFKNKRLKYPNSVQSAPPGTCKVLDGDLGHLKLADSLMNE